MKHIIIIVSLCFIGSVVGHLIGKSVFNADMHNTSIQYLDKALTGWMWYTYRDAEYPVGGIKRHFTIAISDLKEIRNYYGWKVTDVEITNIVKKHIRGVE